MNGLNIGRQSEPPEGPNTPNEASESDSDLIPDAPLKVGVFASGIVGSQVTAILHADSQIELRFVGVVESDQIPFAPFAPSSGLTLLDQPIGSTHTQHLRSAELDLLILAWWPYIVPSEVLHCSEQVLNLHPSLLPHNRGKDPNFWSIVEERPFGVTIHWVDGGIDTGHIAFQRELAVSWEDTGASLYTRASAAIVELFGDVLPFIKSRRIPRISQGDAGSFHRRSELEPASEFDLDELTTPRQLLNLLRARTFEPHPAARFTVDGLQYEVRVAIKQLRVDTPEST